MIKADVVYLFHTQAPLEADAQQGLLKSLKRLRLDQVYVAEDLSAEAQTAYQGLLQPFFEEHTIPCANTETSPPVQAPAPACLWILPLAEIQNYLTNYSPAFEAKSCDLIVVNTTKRSYRSLSF